MSYLCFVPGNCSYLLFDMVEGSFERIVNGNTFLLALERSGLMHYMIKKRQLSYEVMDQVRLDHITVMYSVCSLAVLHTSC